MNKTLASVQNFVHNHKTGIAVATTLVVVGGIHMLAVKSWNEFLAEKGLTEEYYNPDAD